MRNLVYAINISIDGCCDHTKFYPDEDTMEYFTQLTRDTGTFLYGRKTYELMIPYWPDAAKEDPSDEFAQAFDAVGNIVVFSQTLENPVEKKTRIIIFLSRNFKVPYLRDLVEKSVFSRSPVLKLAK